MLYLPHFGPVLAVLGYANVTKKLGPLVDVLVNDHGSPRLVTVLAQYLLVVP